MTKPPAPYRVRLEFEVVVQAESAASAITQAKRLVRRPGQPTAYLTGAAAERVAE
jgi:hypothetical protein